MQTLNSKSNHIDVDQKTTVKSSSDSISSSLQQATLMSKDRSPKMIRRRSPQGCVNEKRSSKFSDLEACIAQLQEELKMVKEQASSSEDQKKQAQQEVAEGNRRISALAAELEETKRQLTEITSIEDDRLQELCKLSKERDKVWESELEAVRKQHSMDITALTSAMYGIQKLMKQVETVTEMEAVQTKRAEFAEREVQRLKFELEETLLLVDRLKADVKQCRFSEVLAQEMLNESTNMVQSTTEDVTQPFNSLSSNPHELENCEAATQSNSELADKEKINQLEHEILNLRSEVSQLRAALDAAEVRYQEEYIQSTLQIRSAYELVEVTKSESRIREAELEAELNEIPRLSDKENILAMELKKAIASLADTKAMLIEKDKQLETVNEEKEILSKELQKLITEKVRVTEDAAVLAEAQKVLKSKVIYLTQESNQNSKMLAQMREQRDAAQAAKTEVEVELKRLMVQCDQWRKAAEAAAVMLTTGSDYYLDRSESLDNSNDTIGGHLSSPTSDEMDDDPSKKKFGNMLQKMGVRWKKSNSSKQLL